MKKIIFGIITGIAMLSSVQAQTKLALGIKVGANLSNVYDTKGEILLLILN